MAELFGFEIKRKLPEKELPSFAPKLEDDGAAIIAEGGIRGTYVDMEGSVRSEAELVTKYRDMALHPEIDIAVDDIINESIVVDPKKPLVTLNLDALDQPPIIKEMVMAEFEYLKVKLEFNQYPYEIFKKWYVDGRLYYHVIIDEANPKLGILDLRYIDSRKIRKVRTMKKKKIKDITVSENSQEFFIYNEKGFAKTTAGYTGNDNTAGTIKIAKDSVILCTSGLLSPSGDMVIGYLHKAIKPLNQLRSMEDSLVIYRISRAPERRIFYIDVGNLPKAKAEQYLRDVMTRFKNKLVYDAASGEIRDDRKFMTMLEDFWLPRRADGKATEITTLPGGQNLGQIDDIVYFQKKLFQALNVPVNRLDPEAAYNIGRATEITRDEVKFAKFVQRLRARFSDLFNKLLEKQLVLKGIITSAEWEYFRNAFVYEYSEDNHFAELRNTEILAGRIAMLRDIDDFAGKYVSHEWIRKQVLYQSEEQMLEIDQQIMDERTNEQYYPVMDNNEQPITGPNVNSPPSPPKSETDAPPPPKKPGQK